MTRIGFRAVSILPVITLLWFGGTAASMRAENPHASDQCSVQAGQVIISDNIEALLKRVGDKAAPRGEFETSAQYEARLSALQTALPKRTYISIPIDTKYIAYNADTSKFALESYALDNRNASWEVLFGEKSPLGPRLYGAPSYVDLVLTSTETVTGTYPAKNAYGASITVSEISRRTVGILERPAQGSEDLFFPDRPRATGRTNVVGEIAVDPATAPTWRQNLRAFALVRPKAPFVAHGSKYWGAPRIDRPTEIRENLTALIADIECVVLTDARNSTLATIATR